MFVGPVLDDWLFAHALGDARVADVYDFVASSDVAALRDAGRVPWWTDDAFQQRFLRPLAALAWCVDHRGGPVVAGLSLLLWRALALWGGWELFRTELPGPRAHAALLWLATENGLVAAGAWQANRHGLIAAALCTWSLVALVRGRSLVSAGLFALALAAGELSLGLLGFALAYAAVGGRWREVVGHGAVAGLWAALYVALGRGARGGDFYLDPLGDPVGFATAAPLRLLPLIGDAVTQVPSMLGFLEGAWPLGLAALGLLACVALRGAGWLGLGAVLALVPAVGAPPSSRQLAVASVGFAVVVARLPVPAVVGLAGLGALLSLQSSWGLHRVGERSLDIAASVDTVCPDGPVALVNPPDHVVGFYLPVLREEALGRAPRVIVPLTMRRAEVAVWREGARVRLDGPLLTTQIERYWGTRLLDTPVHTGPFVVHAAEGLSVEAPADTCWLAWTAAGLERFEPGAEPVTWTRAPGPSGLP